jgi:ubiquinone/menaquinone biosynthesis C-methylase UbiE
MDAPGVDAVELERSLADLRGVNRWLGGESTALGAVLPLVRRLKGREVRVLDVATGSGDLPLALSRRARAAGVRVRIVATDLHEGTLAAARAHTAADPNVRVQSADALALPFEDGAFDLAMCHTALHHFDEHDAIRALRELNRVARCGVVVTDLYRSRPALLGARLLAVTVWRRHPVTRHDGPHSVAAAFTPRELEEMAAAAGLNGARVRTRPVFRAALVVDRTAGCGGP